MSEALEPGESFDETLLHVEPSPREEPRSAADRVDLLAFRWEAALDAAQSALQAASFDRHADLSRYARHLTQERQQARASLESLARTLGAPAPWLPPHAVSPRALGLPEDAEAVVFDLDGVLTDSAVFHAAAWAETLNAFLLQRGEEIGWRLEPFDLLHDYRAYLDGRPRLEGVHAFLSSRGLRLSEGTPSDQPGKETAWGLANQKGLALERELRHRSVHALRGARHYVKASRYAGLRCAVVSASANTRAMLETSGLSGLIEGAIDARTLAQEGLRPRPAPDAWIYACRLLGAEPRRAVAFVHDLAGVVAARRAELELVVDIDHGEEGRLTLEAGADDVIPGLESWLPQDLRPVVT